MTHLRKDEAALRRPSFRRLIQCQSRQSHFNHLIDGHAGPDTGERGRRYAQRQLYAGDAPHAACAFRIRGSDGRFLAQPEFLGTTLPGLRPATIDGVETYPIHHAKGVLFAPDTESILAPSGGWGLRRGEVSAIENGKGSLPEPALVVVDRGDLYEHRTSINPGSDLITGPERALGVAVKGNLAYVADGSRGLCVYDLARDSATAPGFVVGNIANNGGGGTSGGGSSGRENHHEKTLH